MRGTKNKMDFYDKKKRAFAYIRKLYDGDANLDSIYFNVMDQYGFGKNFVDTSLNLIDRQDGRILRKKPAIDKEAEAEADKVINKEKKRKK